MKKVTCVLLSILSFALVVNISNAQTNTCLAPETPSLSYCSEPLYVKTDCVVPTSYTSIQRESEQMLYDSCIYLQNSRIRAYKSDEERYLNCQKNNNQLQIDYSNEQEKYSVCLLSELKKQKSTVIDDTVLHLGIIKSQKLYPDAKLTGTEKTADEVHNKIIKSGSYKAYQKTKKLTVDQIIENINTIGNNGGTIQDMQDYVDFLKLYQLVPKLTTKKHPVYSTAKLAKIIRSRYTGYEKTSDKDLVNTFVKMYPVLKDRVTITNSKK